MGYLNCPDSYHANRVEMNGVKLAGVTAGLQRQKTLFLRNQGAGSVAGMLQCMCETSPRVLDGMAVKFSRRRPGCSAYTPHSGCSYSGTLPLCPASGEMDHCT